MHQDKRLIDLTASELEALIKQIIHNTLLGNETRQVTVDGAIYIDIDELSQFLKISKPSIYRMVGKRTIPFYRSGERKLLFKVDEIKNWVEKSRKKFNNLKM